MNPYRTPGTKDCITELVEDVIANALPPPAMSQASSVLRGRYIAEATQLQAINMCVGPRLEATHIFIDPLTDGPVVSIRGRGGVTCDLRFSSSDLIRRGLRAGRQLGGDAHLFGLIEAILERLPE